MDGMKPQLRRALLILAIGALVIAGVAAGVWYLRGDNAEIRSGGVVSGGGSNIGGAFQLTDQDGQRRSQADFAGKYVLVYFGFTYCVDACPLALLTMTQALDRLPPAVADKVQPLFVTVDPARDDPAQIKTYLETFPPRFVGLTGTPEEIAAAARAWRVVYEPPKPAADGTYQVSHTTIVYLMGPDGAFLRHFDHLTKAEEMTEALQALVK